MWEFEMKYNETCLYYKGKVGTLKLFSENILRKLFSNTIFISSVRKPSLGYINPRLCTWVQLYISLIPLLPSVWFYFKSTRLLFE